MLTNTRPLSGKEQVSSYIAAAGAVDRERRHLMEALYGVVPDKASITLHVRLSALWINRPSGCYVLSIAAAGAVDRERRQSY